MLFSVRSRHHGSRKFRALKCRGILPSYGLVPEYMRAEIQDAVSVYMYREEALESLRSLDSAQRGVF